MNCYITLTFFLINKSHSLRVHHSCVFRKQQQKLHYNVVSVTTFPLFVLQFHVLQFHVLHFHVLQFPVPQFHVLQFHALQLGPSISRPAFSCPGIWFVFFMSCNFMSCNFDGPSFSCPLFSVNPIDCVLVRKKNWNFPHLPIAKMG